MRIRSIEYENFRNFRDRGKITCSTDGKVTIIYGKNGDGKTTLHQLFQWIFYGDVHFNRTTTDKLYNLQFESDQKYGDTFTVMGRIDFEHNGEMYSLTRIYTYKKGLEDSEKIAEDFSLSKRDDDFNWKRINHPLEVVEKLLPSGLSDYFFFDGENMIADLRVKGKDSASKLRKALYSMFDLDVIEAAIDHIGRTDLKTTVLGQLYLSKGPIASGGNQINRVKSNIENAQVRKESYQAELEEARSIKEQRKKIIQDVSERIGSSKSKQEYEKERRHKKSDREVFLKNADKAKADFGERVVEMFPQLLISKAVSDAQKRIHLKVADNHLPEGISKHLIHYLLSKNTEKCICGHTLGDEERAIIKSYLEMMPPHSYTNMYNEFTHTAQRWGNDCNFENIESYIAAAIENQQHAEGCDKAIRELDEEEKKSPDIEDLIVARGQAEEDVKVQESNISKSEIEIKKLDLYLKKQMSEFDKLTEASENQRIAQAKISVMEEVLQHFKDQLDRESCTYSRKLQDNIQVLIDQMLTSRRKVSVSSEFSVRITDSYNDESKSEGQFAVVSFAYIGGILKLLQTEERLSSKEYPLVLDGPFSKLDPDQRQNVVNMIPSFAPQVILFSKDDLSDVFEKESVGRIWTITSNEEKNVAKVEEGYQWK